MKKTLFFAIVAFLSAGILNAEELKINGEFKAINPRTKLPVSWERNGVKTGISEVIRKGDDNILKLKNDKGYFAMYSNVKIPAKVGDTYKFEIKAKGKGTLSVGYYAYGTKGHCGTLSQTVKVDSALLFKEYKGTFTVAPAAAGKDLVYIHIQFGSYGAMDVEIEEIEVEPVVKQ